MTNSVPRCLIHLLDPSKEFTLENLQLSIFARCTGKAGDCSDGPVYLVSRDFAYRRGLLLVGKFKTSELAEQAMREQGGFMPDETFLKINNMLTGFLVFHNEPPARKLTAAERRAAVQREPGAEIPPEGFSGQWLHDEREAARYCGVNRVLLRQWRSRGKGPRWTMRPGHRVAYTQADLAEWMQGGGIGG